MDEDLYLTRKRTHVVMPSAPMYIIFDQAVDQTLYSPKPDNPEYQGDGVYLRVEWVRVYKQAST